METVVHASKIQQFRVSHFDDYRTGPALRYRWVDNSGSDGDGDSDSDGDDDTDSDESNEDGDAESYLVKFIVDARPRVYHLLLNIGDYEARMLAQFDTVEEAETFAKQQYFLYTNGYPFIVTGMGPAYKSTGSREAIPIPTDAVCVLEEPGSDDAYEYLIIVNREELTAHSLNCFAEW